MNINEKFRSELTETDHIKDYVLGGHGIVTLVSDTTNVHHTYSFHKPEGRDDIMFINTLVDGSNWVYVGYYRNGEFRLTAKSAYKPDSAIVKGVAYIFKVILGGTAVDSMHILHEGVCCRCGRPLTNPASIRLGIGPTCMSKL